MAPGASDTSTCSPYKPPASLRDRRLRAVSCNSHQPSHDGLCPKPRLITHSQSTSHQRAVAPSSPKAAFLACLSKGRSTSRVRLRVTLPSGSVIPGGRSAPSSGRSEAVYATGTTVTIQPVCTLSSLVSAGSCPISKTPCSSRLVRGSQGSQASSSADMFESTPPAQHQDTAEARLESGDTSLFAAIRHTCYSESTQGCPTKGHSPAQPRPLDMSRSSPRPRAVSVAAQTMRRARQPQGCTFPCASRGCFETFLGRSTVASASTPWGALSRPTENIAPSSSRA